MDFLNLIVYLRAETQNRRLLARAVLNTCGHAKDFPVDISRLRVLSPHNRAVLNGFRQYAYSDPRTLTGGFYFELLEMANSA